jgi:Zn-dependent M16 (insulinase) family peptidase
MLLSGLTYEDLVREREEIINVTQEDIRAFYQLVQSVLDEGNICVIGNESMIDKDKDLFLEVKSLMK